MSPILFSTGAAILRRGTALAIAFAAVGGAAAAQKPGADEAPSQEEVEQACWQVHERYRAECIAAGGPRARLEQRRAERRSRPYVPEGLPPEQQRYNGPYRGPTLDGPGGRNAPGSTAYNGPYRGPVLDGPGGPNSPGSTAYNGPYRGPKLDGPGGPNSPGSTAYNGPYRGPVLDGPGGPNSPGATGYNGRYRGPVLDGPGGPNSPGRTGYNGPYRGPVLDGPGGPNSPGERAARAAPQSRPSATGSASPPPNSPLMRVTGRPPAPRVIARLPRADARISDSTTIHLGDPAIADRVADEVLESVIGAPVRAELERMFPRYRGAIRILSRLNLATGLVELWAVPLPTDSNDVIQWSNE
jgi:hypothetical protein